MKNWILFGFVSLVVTACATPNPGDPNYDPGACGYDGGYGRGYNDGRAQKPMDMGFTQWCPFNDKEYTREGYRAGYSKGSGEEAAAAAPVPAAGTVPAGNHSSKVININIGGTQTVNQPDSSRKDHEPKERKNKKKYYCEVKAFMQKFEAFGPTQLETKTQVQKECAAQFSEMHCRKVVCQENK